MPVRSGSRSGDLPATIKVLDKDGQEELIRKAKKEVRRDRRDGSVSSTAEGAAAAAAAASGGGGGAGGTEGKKRGYEPPARHSSLDDAVGEVVKQLEDVERKVREKRKSSRKASSGRRKKSSGERKDDSRRHESSRRRSSDDRRDDDRRYDSRRGERSSRRYRESLQEVGVTSYETGYAAMPSNGEAGRSSLSQSGGGDNFLSLCHGSESFSDMEPPSKTQRARARGKASSLPLSPSQSTVGGTTWSEDAFHYVKQSHSMASITICAIQLLVLMLQLAMCGVAPFDVNPMVGPFPDAFSEWGGKNVYLMLVDNQWWRLITPAFLHVGVVHLLANAFCLLYSSALFEREWGSWSWVFIYFVSEIGCIGVSSITDPETIAVGSSGALMGLFAAKLAHTLTYTFFATDDPSQDDGVHLDQLGSALCSLTVVSLMSSFTYVDWSGHMGGLFSGFFAGILVFSGNVQSICGRIFWALIGLGGLGGCGYLVAEVMINHIIPDEDMEDVCDYFRNLFTEDYDCGCLWS